VSRTQPAVDAQRENDPTAERPLAHPCPVAAAA
jgi:hypothetical protein